MSTGVVAVGAAAVAYFAYSRSRKSLRDNGEVVETHTRFEHAPTDWTGELFLFGEALRHIYVETLGRWPTADLFIGLVYLARQGLRDFPAKEIVAHGKRVDTRLLGAESKALLCSQLTMLRRLLLYSQNLKYSRGSNVLEGVWADVGVKKEDFLIYNAKAAVLRPAYVLVKDDVLKSLVLAVRGTQTLKDLFTSLSSAAKPHHMVNSRGVVLGHSHFGMLAAARWLLKETMPTITAALQDNPGYDLLLTGHSMGGGTAAILTMMIREQFPSFGSIRCITFACPGCVTLDIAQSCSEYITTVVYGTDVVPTLSPAALDHLREDVAKSSWSRAFKHDVRSSSMVRAVEGRVRGFMASVSTLASTSFRGCTGARPGRGHGDHDGKNSEVDEEIEGLGDFEPSDGNKEVVEDGRDADQKLPESRPLGGTDTSAALPEIMAAENNVGACPPDESQSGAVSTLSRSLSNMSLSLKDRGEEGATAVGEWGRRTKESIAEGVGGFWSQMWSKRNQSGAAHLGEAGECLLEENAPDVGDGIEDEEVEGVFDGRSAIEVEDEQKDLPGSSSVPQEVIRKRQLYPAGRILHLVPAFILNADNGSEDEDPESAEEQEFESGQEGEICSDTQIPVSSGNLDLVGDSDDEDAEFVLFTDLPHEAYCQVRMSRSMVVDHFVPRYREAIESLLGSMRNMETL